MCLFLCKELQSYILYCIPEYSKGQATFSSAEAYFYNCYSTLSLRYLKALSSIESKGELHNLKMLYRVQSFTDKEMTNWTGL